METKFRTTISYISLFVVPLLPMLLFVLPEFQVSTSFIIFNMNLHIILIIFIIIDFIGIFASVVLLINHKIRYLGVLLIEALILILLLYLMQQTIYFESAFVIGLIPSLLSIGIGIIMSFFYSCFKGEFFDYEEDKNTFTVSRLFGDDD